MVNLSVYAMVISLSYKLKKIPLPDNQYVRAFVVEVLYGFSP